MKSAFKLWSLKKKKKLLFLRISVCTVDSVFHMYNQALLKCFHKKKSDQGVPPVIRQLQYSHYQIHTTKGNSSPWTQYHTLSLIFFFFSFLRNFRMSCNLRCLMNQHFLPSLLRGLKDDHLHPVCLTLIFVSVHFCVNHHLQAMISKNQTLSNPAYKQISVISSTIKESTTWFFFLISTH